MSTPPKPYVVALEEHYWDRELAGHFKGADGTRSNQIRERLDDVGPLRLKEMDAAGIDLQVVSHGAPSLQRLGGETAVPLARRVNDRLCEAVRAHPGRFAGFAALPTSDPTAAADELERAVTKLGFKGAMVHGPTNGVFFDDRRFWPIFERAEALDVPLYLHPAVPHPAVAEAYFKDYAKEWPMFAKAAWGYTIETATQGIRLVLSGVFDAHPRLKIILGHLGESLPFSVWRIDQALAREKTGRKGFREYFCEHFWITTSGNFSTPALLCSIMEMGVDRIMFSIDYPFVDNKPGADWMEGLTLSADDKAKIWGGNAKRLLRL
jgi:2,3-dihydroxybenzoate decarboxylase